MAREPRTSTFQQGNVLIQINTDRARENKLFSVFRSAQHAGEFSHFAPLLGFVAGCDCPFDAMRDMVGEDFFLGATQCSADRRELGHDVNAIAVIFDHAGKAPNLTFDPL